MGQPRRQSEIVALLTRETEYVSGPQVLAELRRVIASGQVPAGSPIPLDDVAAFFGVSLIPVREGLKTLLGEGLLDHRPRLGYTVTALSPAELYEVYLVRGALEAAVAEAAARCATVADHERARAAHDAMDEAVDEGNPTAYQRGSRVFHEALMLPSRMPRVLNMLQIAWNLTEPAQAMLRVSEVERKAFHEEHEAMLALFVAGDGEGLRALVTSHHEHVTAAVAKLGRLRPLSGTGNPARR